MTEGKHTPGPWRVGAHGPNGCYTVGTERGLMVAMVAHSVNHPDQKEQAIADAHLIAAAPKLRAALTVALAALESCTPGDYSTGHVIHPEFDEQAVESAYCLAQAALLQSEGGPT